MGNYAVKWLREAVKKENVRNKGDNMNKSNKFMLLGVWVLLEELKHARRSGER